MEIEAALDAVATVGFPIVITGYLLLRMEAKMDKLTEAIGQLSSIVQKEAKP